MLRAAKRRLRVALATSEVRRRFNRQERGRPHDLPSPLIVSVTSYPPRFATLADTLRGLLAQTVRPDATILWLAHGQATLLPPDVLALRSRGLEVRETRDLRSFKKIVPALLAFPEAHVVTADDDLYYRGDWLQALVGGGPSQANAVACHRAHRIRLDASQRPRAYCSWDLRLDAPERGPLVFPTGVMGVLYPPGSLHPHAVRDDLFADLCPSADDVWLWWMHRMTGAIATTLATRQRILEWPGTQTERLSSGNLSQGGNDRAVAAMMARYGLPID